MATRSYIFTGVILHRPVHQPVFEALGEAGWALPTVAPAGTPPDAWPTESYPLLQCGLTAPPGYGFQPWAEMPWWNPDRRPDTCTGYMLPLPDGTRFGLMAPSGEARGDAWAAHVCSYHAWCYRNSPPVQLNHLETDYQTYLRIGGFPAHYLRHHQAWWWIPATEERVACLEPTALEGEEGGLEDIFRANPPLAFVCPGRWVTRKGRVSRQPHDIWLGRKNLLLPKVETWALAHQRDFFDTLKFGELRDVMDGLLDLGTRNRRAQKLALRALHREYAWELRRRDGLPQGRYGTSKHVMRLTRRLKLDPAKMPWL